MSMFLSIALLVLVLVLLCSGTKIVVASTTCGLKKTRGMFHELDQRQLAEPEENEVKPQTKHEGWPKEADWSVYDDPTWKRKGIAI